MWTETITCLHGTVAELPLLCLVSLQTESYGEKMQTMREAWTDERLDDLANRVDRDFDRVDLDLRDIKGEVATTRIELKSEMEARFNAIDARFDRLQQTMLQIGAGLIGTLVVASAGLIATQL